MDPLEKALRAKAQVIAQGIQNGLPDGVGFALLVFDFGPGGFMTWTSNAQREDMVKALRELLERFEAGAEDTGGRGGRA